uniref:CRISPR-associated endoribonuclease Cas2 n=1 Tax=uncultured Thiotrichaceae bacterium TaxID=298394 RepID=A0A6S6ULA6_9GAMM|nr:MAG: CRISPR-associated endoribonuclease Cas2 [uncultured Thiotrichaceae bacterium]
MKQYRDVSGKPKRKLPKSRKQWFVLAYDIREPKRLQRLHYFLKKRALPLQRSVFLLHKKPSELNSILQGVRQRTHKNDDDVRLYPVVSPNSIWAAGKQCDVLSDLYGPVEKEPPAKGLRGLVRTLFGRVA